MPQAVLLQTLGGRIDGCEFGVDGDGVVSRQHLAFGMDHLQRIRATPHFAKTTHTSSDRESLLLGGVEMKKTQIDGATAISHPYDQRAPPAKYHLRNFNNTLDLRFVIKTQGADRREACAILVTQRQVEEQISNACDAQLGQMFGDFFADPVQTGNSFVQINRGSHDSRAERRSLKRVAREWRPSRPRHPAARPQHRAPRGPDRVG